MIGKTLAHYEVLDKLGSGGMGEVYRARDTKLKRDVAVKVLPDSVADDPDRLARFEREAQLLASLNHPNIAAIYGLERHEATHFLVLELVEGEDLSDRLQRGPVTVDEALDIAAQITEALGEAHDKGVIHRDLKPGNIKLTPDGKVKVLDFGLAKAFGVESPEAAPDLSQSPTMTRQGTMAGVILGTAGYMSPEQARGKPVDKRTDMWAVGVVLFEMLSGKRLFRGETVSDTLAAVLRADIDWKALPSGLPTSIERLLRRTLSRDPQTRLRDAGDAQLDIADARSGHADAAPSSSRNPLPWLLAAGALAVAVVMLVMRSDTPDEARTLNVDIAPPAETELVWFSPPALSSDGTKLAFVARAADGVERIHVRVLTSGTATALTGTEGASFPFWSPDGEWLGFFGDGKLQKISSTGGAPLPLADAEHSRGGAWSANGTIVFARSMAGPLYAVAASGGDVDVVTRVGAWNEEVFSHRLPSFLPDGRHFLYSAHTATGYGGAGVLIGSLDSLEPEFVMHTLAARYASGYLLFLRGQTLMAQPFDIEARSLAGESQPLVQSVLPLGNAASGAFTVSATGELVYAVGDLPASRLEWVDRAGQHLGYSGEPGFYVGVTLSPDGRRAILTQADEGVVGRDVNLWLYDVSREIRTRFTFDPGFDMRPVWSPDNEAVIFVSVRSDGTALYRQTFVGAGSEERLFEADVTQLWASGWSLDGRSMTFSFDFDVWILPMEGESEPYTYLDSDDREGFAVFSPDGQWLAYVSDSSGRNEIFVTSFPEPGRRWQISTEGGERIWWVGDELIYQQATGMLVAVEIETGGDSLVVGETRELFLAPRSPGVAGDTVSPSPDAERFLIVRQGDGGGTDPMTLVVNWPATLMR